MSNEAIQVDANKVNDILKFTSSPVKSERIKALNLLESVMKEVGQVDIPVTHRFCGDMYMREITIKKDTLLTGRIHKFDHFDIMLSGDITVSTDDGQVKRLTGLNIFESKAGKKRAGWAHEDTRWITVHVSDERDPEEMAEFLTVETFEQLEEFYVLLEQATKDLKDSEKILLNCAEKIKLGEVNPS